MQLTEAGYFSKTHGVKGHLVLKQNGIYLLPEAKVLFVEINGSKAPHFISDFKMAANNLIIGFDDVETVEAAKLLVGKKVFVEEKYLEREENNNEYLGYEVIDLNFGTLGHVESVSENAHQILLTINYKGKELILPLVEELIEKLDKQKKQIFYKAPEGLIELYLGE